MKPLRSSCPHIRVVFDYFHIVKNFNANVAWEVRKDEQRRLAVEGDKEAAWALKKSKYILASSRETLRRKDKEGMRGEGYFPRRGDFSEACNLP